MVRRIRRHLGWVGGAAVALGSVVLAVTVPSSWWGASFVLGVLGALLAARAVVPESYHRGWTRGVVLVTLAAACAGGAYAFAVEPWGPVPQVAWTLGILLFTVAVASVADYMPSGVSDPATVMGKLDKLPGGSRRPPDTLGR